MAPYSREERRLDQDPVWDLRHHYSDGIDISCPYVLREMRAPWISGRCPECGPVNPVLVPLVSLPTTPTNPIPWAHRARAVDRLQAKTLDPEYYAACDGGDRRYIHAARADERARAQGGAA